MDNFVEVLHKNIIFYFKHISSMIFEGSEPPLILGNVPHECQKQSAEEEKEEERREEELAMISDNKMWIREKSETRGLNITINPSQSQSWAPLLHNLSTESIL